MEHDVFISHAHKDKNIADAICKRLESAKLKCWMTPRDVSASDDRRDATRNAIGCSRVMVLALSENANAEELRALKVDFVSVTEGLDFTTPSGRALAGMLGIFAEFERDILRERVRAGMEHAKTKGVVLGRPATAQVQADQIHQLLAEGMSKKAIARKLGIGRASIYRAIENHAG